MTPKSEDFSRKRSLVSSRSIWAALPGAQHLERCFAPRREDYMTRRAFLALRVIQRHGQFTSNGLVKKWCKWFRKMKISQNQSVQLSPEQFSCLDQLKSYPGMYSLCLSMRFRKSSTEIYVFAWLNKHRDFHDFLIFLEFSEKWSLQAIWWFWAALPGAKPWKGLRPQRGYSIWIVEPF